ncbi:hypothetical protein ACIRD2_18985 [Streptomyces sp. NPDC093595]|uniref:hypothetical protein n=1 Tax=Streptomyces sp. NPDC093595 TaxID=3366045 RepID=UPI003817659D
MNVRRIIRGAGAGLAAMIALAAAAAPANAATVNWQTISPNANWRCEDTIPHATYPGVKFQGCVVANQFGDAQVVLVVNNQGPKAVNIGGWTSSQFGSNVTCADSVLNPGFQRGCFGPTVTVPCNITYANSVHLTVNGSTKIAPAPSLTKYC